MDEPLLFEDMQAWAGWLKRNHDCGQPVWLLLGKKSSPKKALLYPQALEVALCFGWIDSQKKPHDDALFFQRFSRRGAGSKWSKINREKALALIESGAMHAAGLAEVERARKDGRWDEAYAGSRNAEVPDDLQMALEAAPKALAYFKALDRQNRYSILYRINAVKRAETRAKKIKDYVAMLKRGEKLRP